MDEEETSGLGVATPQAMESVIATGRNGQVIMLWLVKDGGLGLLVNLRKVLVHSTYSIFCTRERLRKTEKVKNEKPAVQWNSIIILGICLNSISKSYVASFQLSSSMEPT